MTITSTLRNLDGTFGRLEALLESGTAIPGNGRLVSGGDRAAVAHSGQGDEESFVTAQDEGRATDGVDDLEPPEAPQQGVDARLQLEPGKWRPDAEVDARTEGEVRVGVAVRPELVGGVEDRGVAVRRPEEG